MTSVTRLGLFCDEIPEERCIALYFQRLRTRYSGERERAEDGSYITTEWITFVYVPLLPIRSYRVLPVGKGTNILIHRSQSYQTMRVPLCWAQVRNVYFTISPIVVLLVYFNWSDIQTWVKEDVLKSSLPQSTLQSPAAAKASAYAKPATESAFARLPAGRVVVEQTVERPGGFVTWVYGHIFDDKSTPIKLTLSCSLPAPNGECARLKPGETYHIKFLSDKDEDAYLRVPYTLGTVIVSGAAGKHLVFCIVDEAAVHSLAASEGEERVAVRIESK